MKIAEIADMALDELLLKEKELRQELFNLRLRSRVGQVEKPSRIRDIKRDVARVLTVRNQKFGSGTPVKPAAKEQATVKA